MKKSDRIENFVAGLPTSPGGSWSPCYEGYFTLFNAGQYYEAHDVLEHLWLTCQDDNYLFYKGLIQLAGAFVHLQKQFTRPEHPKDAPRLRPGVRLFRLGEKNIAPYGPHHLGLDVAGLCAVAQRMVAEIEATDYTQNPWNPAHLPQLRLEAAVL